MSTESGDHAAIVRALKLARIAPPRGVTRAALARGTEIELRTKPVRDACVVSAARVALAHLRRSPTHYDRRGPRSRVGAADVFASRMPLTSDQRAALKAFADKGYRVEADYDRYVGTRGWLARVTWPGRGRAPDAGWPMPKQRAFDAALKRVGITRTDRSEWVLDVPAASAAAPLAKPLPARYQRAVAAAAKATKASARSARDPDRTTGLSGVSRSMGAASDGRYPTRAQLAALVAAKNLGYSIDAQLVDLPDVGLPRELVVSVTWLKRASEPTGGPRSRTDALLKSARFVRSGRAWTLGLPLAPSTKPSSSGARRRNPEREEYRTWEFIPKLLGTRRMVTAGVPLHKDQLSALRMAERNGWEVVGGFFKPLRHDVRDVQVDWTVLAKHPPIDPREEGIESGLFGTFFVARMLMKSGFARSEIGSEEYVLVVPAALTRVAKQLKAGRLPPLPHVMPQHALRRLPAPRGRSHNP